MFRLSLILLGIIWPLLKLVYSYSIMFLIIMFRWAPWAPWAAWEEWTDRTGSHLRLCIYAVSGSDRWQPWSQSRCRLGASHDSPRLDIFSLTLLLTFTGKVFMCLNFKYYVHLTTWSVLPHTLSLPPPHSHYPQHTLTTPPPTEGGMGAKSMSTTIGLVVHAAADGIAMGKMF